MLHSLKNNLENTSIPTFSQEKLSSTLLPLPPKNEQEHLTKKLSLLDKWIGSYNVIQQLIDRLNADIYDKLKKSILPLIPQHYNLIFFIST